MTEEKLKEFQNLVKSIKKDVENKLNKDLEENWKVEAKIELK